MKMMRVMRMMELKDEVRLMMMFVKVDEGVDDV